MKTQDEQLAFAKENQRLTDEYSRRHKELAQLKSPEDGEQIKVKLQELSTVLRDMRQLSEAYMNNKLSYESWLEANKDRLLSSEVKEDLTRFHDIELESAVEDMLRQLYEDYLNE